MDEIDRLLLEKKRRQGGKNKGGKVFKGREGGHRHEKSAALISANIARARAGRVVVVGASATVGRNVRREFCRVLGLNYMDPVVVRGDGFDVPGGKLLENHPQLGGGENLKEEEEEEDGEGRKVFIPDTVEHYFVQVEGGGGKALAAAAELTRELGKTKSRRTLIVLSKECGLNVKDSLGALTFLGAEPKPVQLQEAAAGRGGGERQITSAA